MKDLLLIVIVYSVVAFTILFIYGLIIFFKLRKNERELRIIKRNLDALLQSSGSNWQGRPYQQNEDSYSIKDAVVNDQDQVDDTEDREFIKDTLQHSKSHVSATTNSNHKEKDPKVVSKKEIKENLRLSADPAHLKGKILEMLNQYGKPISYYDFTTNLNENKAFAGKDNIIFDLIDQLAKERIIDVRFAGGKLFLFQKEA